MKVIKIPSRKLYKNNKTPLHLAVENNSKEMFELLLISKKVDLNSQDILFHNQKILLFIKKI